MTESFLACLALSLAILVFMFWPERNPFVQADKTRLDYLSERKDAIYENLRDLQFEYRLGKLSDDDYKATKKDLQKELARVLAEVDKLKASQGVPATAPATPAKVVVPPTGYVCPACGAKFPTALKFCGECGKPMRLAQ